MRFVVEPAIFERLPDLFLGAVYATGVKNRPSDAALQEMLEQAADNAASHFRNGGGRIKEDAAILPYREGMNAFGINPSKYMCSIEALATRIAKGKGMPSINAAVDIGNIVSLGHLLPIGAHGVEPDEEIALRLARPGDRFLPFGATEPEKPEPNEPVYAVGDEVRTRRWAWRQSEAGKITEETQNIFFPIDGFASVNKAQVESAAEQLVRLLLVHVGAHCEVRFIDQQNAKAEW